MDRYRTFADACSRWNNSIDLVLDFKKHKNPDKYFEIRYESLVSDPVYELKRTCKFLNVAYEESMLSFYKTVDKLGDTKLSHHSNLKNPINPDSIGKWEKNLSPEQKKLFNKLLRINLTKLGYV